MSNFDEVRTVYEGKEGYAIVDDLQWRQLHADNQRLREENERLKRTIVNQAHSRSEQKRLAAMLELPFDEFTTPPPSAPAD